MKNPTSSRSGLTLGSLISIIAVLIIGAVITSIIITPVVVHNYGDENQAKAKIEFVKFSSQLQMNVVAFDIKPDSNFDGNVSVTARIKEGDKTTTESYICNYRPANFGGGGCRVRTPYDSFDN
jgi:hypothetical protein